VDEFARLRLIQITLLLIIGFGFLTVVGAGVTIYQFVGGHVGAGIVCLIGTILYLAVALFAWRWRLRNQVGDHSQTE
jgi:membrane protein YdbS with pleckstrin-like domain